MYCTKCGAELAVQTSFCPECGANQNAQKTPKKKVGKIVIVIGAACVAVALLIVAWAALLSGVGINASAEKVAATFVENIYEYNTTEMMQCWPDFVLRERASYIGVSPNASRREFAEALKKEAELYEKEEVEILSSRIVEEIDIYDLLDYDDYYGFTYDEFEQFNRAVYVEVVCQRNGESYSDSYEVLCVQMGNKWYMMDVD